MEKERVDIWLASKRRDALIAGARNLAYRQGLVEKAHKVCLKADADGSAVMCGGFATDATCGVSIEVCGDCGELVIPTVDHLLWDCHVFSHLRKMKRPCCPVMARLGWSTDDSFSRVPLKDAVALVSQMGAIRALANSRRFQRWGATARQNRASAGLEDAGLSLGDAVAVA